MDFDNINHRIGNGSSYDGDMDLIESFVKFTKEPDNVLLSMQLNSYYISRALSYWDTLKKYLIQDNIIELNNYSGNKNDRINLKIILDRMDEYETKFIQMIDDTGRFFNNEEFIKIFTYIGRLNCLIPTVDNLNQNFGFIPDIGKTFLILNDNGAFSLNTWLYSFFEGIDLAGFTSREAEFDGEVGCSIDMFEHDTSHLRNSIFPKKGTDEFITMKIIYYNIINSPRLSKMEKELYILVLWMIVHEYVDPVNFTQTFEGIIQKFITWSYADTAAEGQMPEFIKFSHILLNENNVNDAIYYFNNFKFSGHPVLKKPFTRDFSNFIDSLENRDNLIDYHYMFLALVYVVKDLKNNYEMYTSWNFDEY